MKKFTVLFCAILALVSQGVLAKQNPKGLVTDRRIKVVPYDANNVVEVHTTFGYATTIILEKGEYITQDGGMGKKAGWQIASKPKSNFIAVKPMTEDNTTNLNFATNKGRVYSLLLDASSEKRGATFIVRYEYPRMFDNSPFASRIDTYNLISGFGNPHQVNENYSFTGDTMIAPIQAKDNGRFTLLKFRRGAPIPAILAVDLKTRKESLVNFRVQGEYVVVEGVYSQFTLRYGAHVTCLFNDKAISQWVLAKRGPVRVKRRTVVAKRTLKHKQGTK